jgi:hypothetical protein
MHSYRQKGLVDLPTTARAPKKSKLGYVNFIRTQYDDSESLDTDSTDDPSEGEGVPIETVDQEYHKWVIGSRPAKDIDQLDFWEVCEVFLGNWLQRTHAAMTV